MFAAAAVGVGFGAAGLVGDPFTDGDVGTTTSAGSDAPATPSSTPTPTASSSPAATPSSSGTATGGADGTPVTRSRTTQGGLVSGTCEGGLVRLSVSPYVGWEVDDLDAGARDEARVRFERVDDGEGKVEVRATCSGDTPTFNVRDDSSGSGGSGSDDSDDD